MLRTTELLNGKMRTQESFIYRQATQQAPPPSRHLLSPQSSPPQVQTHDCSLQSVLLYNNSTRQKGSILLPVKTQSAGANQLETQQPHKTPSPSPPPLPSPLLSPFVLPGSTALDGSCQKPAISHSQNIHALESGHTHKHTHSSNF
jgi:hypothetical protein